MFDKLKNALLSTLETLDDISQPRPLPATLTLAEMLAEAERVGGDGSRVQIECSRYEGKVRYGFTIWGPAMKPLVTEMNQHDALALFAMKCAPRPEPHPEHTTEQVNCICPVESTAPF